MYRPCDPSRGGSPTNDDDIFTAGEGQAPSSGRKCREDSCVCTGVEGLDGAYTNTRSRSSSCAQEAHNGSDSIKAQTKAKDTEKSSLPLHLEPKLMTVSLGLRKRGIPSQKDSGQYQTFANIHFPLISFTCPKRHVQEKNKPT